MQAELTISSMDSLERMIADTEKDILKVRKIDIDKADKYLSSKDK